MDVKTIFLNKNLDEEVYMNQPEGFCDYTNSHLFCKLKKSINRLKQPPNSDILNFIML